MHVSFIYPAALALLVLLPAFWALAAVLPRRLAPARFAASVAVRSFLLVALVLSIAGAQIVRSVDRLSTVFLLDASDSIAPSVRARAEAFVQDALSAMRSGDQAAIVVFGENALVERSASDDRVFARAESAPVVARTNLQEAIQLGLALFPADTQKRLVLLSDGGQNAGDALQAARLAETRHVPIRYVLLSAPPEAEVLLADLRAPSAARVGQQLTLKAVVESTLAQPATLRLWSDERLLASQSVDLVVGVNQYELTINAAGQGFQHLRAEVSVEQDGYTQNNQAEALVRIDGPPRVLIVEGSPGLGENLARALAAKSIAAEVVVPEATPGELAVLSQYDAVTLVNVPAQALPIKTVANLDAYVRELGGGLLMIGGDHSYGLGGYSHTPIEAALPVYMDVRNREVRPDLALVFIVDKSGSMDSCHCSGPNRRTAQISREGTPKIDIAKDAVAQAAALLRPSDTLGVVAFDRASQWVLPPQAGASLDALTNALAPIKPDGGTNVRAGLQAAEQALNESTAQIKHAILLTDGWSSGGDNADIAERMRANGITLSVVAAGNGSAEYLDRLATAGGGRYYPTASMDEVPQIFVQETITAAGNYIIEEPFTPALVAPSPVLEGLAGGLPKLYGYNGTTPKDAATVVLAGVDHAPILAQWQYGLGRSIAWTSDASGKWGKDWVLWPEFPRFAAQLFGWVLPTQSAQNLDTAFSTEGAETVIDVRVRGAAGERADNLMLRARLVGGQVPVPLQQVAPGQYRARFADLAQGTYLVQVQGEQDGHAVAQQIAGLVVSYSPEYRLDQQNKGLLAAIASATGGTQIAEPAAAFAPAPSDATSAQEISLPLLLLALLLLPLDIALRRLSLRRADFTALRRFVPGRTENN